MAQKPCGPGDESGGAAKIQDSRWWNFLEPLEDPAVRAFRARLERVGLVLLTGLRVREPLLPQAILQDVQRHITRVLHAVDVTDFVAVVSRDTDLFDALSGVEQLDDDLRVEVKAVGVALEGDL